MSYRSHSIFFLQKITVVTIFAVFVLPSLALAQEEVHTLDSHWQYRWGDSELDVAGFPKWITESIEQKQWISIDFPSNPPNRDGKKNVWYRTILPNDIWRDPVLYIFSVDLITEVYTENRKIYQYGTFNQHGQGRFEGWPWHMISLPKDFSGKVIYFRIFSSASDIGLWGEIKIMERLTLLRYVIDNSITDVIASGLSLLIALLALIFASVQSNRRPYLLIFFFTFSSSIMLLAQSQIKQLLFNAPFIWDHIAATAYFVLPIAMALLFSSWCPGRFAKLIKAIWQFHVVFVCISIGGSVFGFFELSSMYYLFDFLLTISLLILFIITFSQFKTVENDIKVLVSAFALFSLFLLIDMGVAHNILPWTRMPISIGLLLFSLTLVAVSLRHFVIVQNALKELNEKLEQKVEDRTKELKRIASTDPLTELMNRRAFYLEAERIFQSAKRYQRIISMLMLDIDHFKRFNDSYGHAVGDAVLISVANCIKKVCRETDLPARFGGEEFVILLEAADKTKALITAERLRQSINTIKISNINHTITASIGVSVLQMDVESLDALLLRADQTMYIAKDKGRNNCQVFK